MDPTDAMKKQLETDIENFQNTIRQIQYQAARQIKDFEILIAARKAEIETLETK